MKGKINWYDEASKRGSIIGEDNNWYRIHEYTLMPENQSLKPGTLIKFELANSSIHPIVTYITSKGI